MGGGEERSAVAKGRKHQANNGSSILCLPLTSRFIRVCEERCAHLAFKAHPHSFSSFRLRLSCLLPPSPPAVMNPSVNPPDTHTHKRTNGRIEHEPLRSQRLLLQSVTCRHRFASPTLIVRGSPASRSQHEMCIHNLQPRFRADGLPVSALASPVACRRVMLAHVCTSAPWLLMLRETLSTASLVCKPL